ncbi:MAG: response regulator [Planctomycetota bacterium]
MGPKELHVFMVDDDEVDALVVDRTLRRSKLPFSLQVAPSGVDAFARFDQLQADGKPLPHLILLDINMPEMSGHEFLERLRASESLRGIVVFMLTTSDEASDVARAYKRHVAGYIVKHLLDEQFGGLLSLLERYSEVVVFDG